VRIAAPCHAPSPPSLAARFLRDGPGLLPLAESFPSFGHAVLSGRPRVLSQGRGLQKLARRKEKLGIEHLPFPRSLASRDPAPRSPRSQLLGEARHLPTLAPLNPRLARPRLKLAPRVRSFDWDRVRLTCRLPSFAHDRARLTRRSASFAYDRARLTRRPVSFAHDRARLTRRPVSFAHDRARLTRRSASFAYDRARLTRRPASFAHDRARLTRRSASFAHDRARLTRRSASFAYDRARLTRRPASFAHDRATLGASHPRAVSGLRRRPQNRGSQRGELRTHGLAGDAHAR